MATRKQVGNGAKYGLLMGAAVTGYFFWKGEIPFPIHYSLLAGGGAGLLLGLLLARWLGAPNDTVMYFLRRRGRIVYVGIAYLRRAEGRVAEHRRGGKRFDRVDWSRPMSRKDALKREKNTIKRYKPQYNLAHNNG